MASRRHPGVDRGHRAETIAVNVLAISAHCGSRRRHDAESLQRCLASRAEDVTNLIADATHRPTIERIE